MTKLCSTEWVMPLLRGSWKLTGKISGIWESKILGKVVIPNILVFTTQLDFRCSCLKCCYFLTDFNVHKPAVCYWFLSFESISKNFWVHFGGNEIYIMVLCWWESEFFQTAISFSRLVSFHTGSVWFDLFNVRQWVHL